MNSITTGQASQELDSIVSHFREICFYRKGTVQTPSGKIYEVQLVVHSMYEYRAAIFPNYELFLCSTCNKGYPGKNFYQIQRGGVTIRISDSTLHLFRQHPDKVLKESLNAVIGVIGV